ncbi:AAA family ATPase [Methanogenium cariaci]|uniref:AAA family ATPase n=1 Tax=Methanogenium cariaci TaxID=2197 RepID=UPI000785FABE|nr:AAA family ATPase [Methanogenium cariaci]
MIERINNIETVGLYHRAKGSSFGFKKANLIYADNCRGKSTLASIFESCSTGDPSIITSRKTLGSENEQYVDIQFDCGHKVTFDGAQWSEKRQEILVFDADFVERNVYSGGQITPDQRQNLLQFAIGDRAVTTQNEYNLSLENLQNIKINIGSLEDQLNGHHIGLSLREFDEIEFIEEPDKKIEQLRSRLDNAKNIVNLQAKEIPKKLEIPLFDIDSIFFGLNFSLKDVDIEAETKVKDHIKKQRGANLENWLFNGLSHENDEKCPYCGQEITGLDLVKSYRTYFNHEYRLLLKNIEELPQKCEELCSEEVVNNLNNSFSKSRITADNWKEDVDLDELSFESDIALENIRSIYLRLNELISRKQSNPLEKVVQESDKNYIISKWHEVLNCIDNCNTQIDKAIHLIKVFKTNLDSEDIDNLNKQISDIEWSKKRYDPTVVELIEKTFGSQDRENIC